MKREKRCRCSHERIMHTGGDCIGPCGNLTALSTGQLGICGCPEFRQSSAPPPEMKQ